MKDFKQGGGFGAKKSGGISGGGFANKRGGGSFGGRSSGGGFRDRPAGSSFDRRDSGDRGFGRGGFRGASASARPAMHTATCAECGNSCEVPFKPTGDRPVYCSNCFKAKDGGSAPRSERSFSADRSFTKPSYSLPIQSSAPSNDQLEKLNSKLDQILVALKSLAPVSTPKVVPVATASVSTPKVAVKSEVKTAKAEVKEIKSKAKAVKPKKVVKAKAKKIKKANKK